MTAREKRLGFHLLLKRVMNPFSKAFLKFCVIKQLFEVKWYTNFSREEKDQTQS